MFKPVTKKQTNKFQENYGKFISTLFGVEVVGDTKKEAEEYLAKFIQWNMEQFQKIYQFQNHLAILKRSRNAINQYEYARIENGLAQGSTIFSAESDRVAETKGNGYFSQYLDCV